MKILLTGYYGQVGDALKRMLGDRHQVVAVEHDDFDLTDEDALRRKIREVSPDLVINPAAYTAVDRAESEPALAEAVNARVPGLIAEELARIDGMLIHYSTDYVFDGHHDVPYREDDQPNPLSVYGRTKLAGEQAIAKADIPYLVFRTSWVYSTRGHNFLLTMRKLICEHEELSVVDDQVGAPTSARAIAAATVKIIDQIDSHGRDWVRDRSGIYHMTCGGQTSWHGFAKAIAARIECPDGKAVIHPIPTEAYPTPAHRPAWSVLDNSRLHETFEVRLPDWESALDEVLSDVDDTEGEQD